MNSIYRIAVSCLLLIAFLLTGCVVISTPQISKFVLLAPFEGRYSEIGYDALYAARLALSENPSAIDLVAIDDGSSVENAISRAQAITQDQAVSVVLAIGPFATSENVQQALGALPTIIIGGWSATTSSENVYILSSENIPALLTQQDTTLFDVLDSDNTVNVDERLALPQIIDLSDELEHITIYSSATLPDADFTQRYLNSAEFTPEPGLLASLTYDATAIALEHIATNQPIHDIVHEGLNGQIQFEGGYWQQAPVFIYRYENDLLTYIAD